VVAQTAGSLGSLFEEGTQQFLANVLHHLTDIGPGLRAAAGWRRQAIRLFHRAVFSKMNDSDET
jgi:hypothetical protein